MVDFDRFGQLECLSPASIVLYNQRLGKGLVVMVAPNGLVTSLVEVSNPSLEFDRSSVEVAGC